MIKKEKKEYVGLRTFKPNSENPFRDETIKHIIEGEKVILLASKNPDLIIDSDGQVKGHSLFARRQKVDKAQFLKIYTSAISSLFGLSKNGIKVFGYVLSILNSNNDYIFFDISECLKFTGYSSKKSVIVGISELLEYEFMARSNITNKYFINPTIFFNGDRLTLLEEYIVDDKNRKFPLADEDEELQIQGDS